MPLSSTNGNGRQTRSDRFYERALTIAVESGVPFLVGGAFAFGRYTGIHRDTKDLDLFVRGYDCPALLQAYADRGDRCEPTFSHWLSKVYRDDHFVDVIFSSGNGVARVDDAWFDHAVPEELWGVKVRLIPAEEMIWSKGFVMERERFDGADIAHVLHACGDQLDWERLLRRFGEDWRVLLSHLILFEFIYPQQRQRIPSWVMETLADRLRDERSQPSPQEPVCRGTLLSRGQYLRDITEGGLQDARLEPHGTMTPDQVAHWTDAIEM